MTTPSARRVAFGMSLLTILACGGSFSPNTAVTPPPQQPFIYATEPVHAKPGDTVSILGNQLTGSAVQFNNALVAGNVLSDAEITFVVPQVSDGTYPLTVVNSSMTATTNFRVAPQLDIAESEPNDQTPNPVGNDRRCHGTLSAGDVDKYTFGSCLNGWHYAVKVTPRIVDHVVINGTTVNLDANGRGVATTADGTFTVVIAGGTGTYQIDLTAN